MTKTTKLPEFPPPWRVIDDLAARSVESGLDKETWQEYLHAMRDEIDEYLKCFAASEEEYIDHE